MSHVRSAMEDAFVEWVNAFPCKSHTVDTIVELADGIIFSEILADIDPKWFKKLTASDPSENWGFRLNNQKKIYKAITHYFEEAIGQDPELLPSVNLSVIAKDADLNQLLLMCQLLVVVAVHSDNNRMYIDMIQHLTQPSQHSLMMSIEQLIQYFDTEPTFATYPCRFSISGKNSVFSEVVKDMPYRHQVEFGKSIAEKKQAENQYYQLLSAHKELKVKYEDALMVHEGLKNRLHSMGEAVAEANEVGKADHVMKKEIDHIKQEIAKSEDRRHEVETLAEVQIVYIEDLKKKVEELTFEAEEVPALQDRLEEYKFANKRIYKIETTIENYKKKFEDTSNLKRQIKVMEEQNSRLLERGQQVEDEYRNVLSFKTLMDSYKEQIQQLEFGNQEMFKENSKLQGSLTSINETCAYLESDRAKTMEHIQLLEESIKELELGGGTILEKITNSRETINEDSIEEENTMEENVKRANVTELCLTIGRLRRKIKEMETLSTIVTKELYHLTDEAHKKQHNIHENYGDAKKEIENLREQLRKIRKGIPDSVLNQNKTMESFSLRISDLQKESYELKNDTKKLKEMVLEGTRNIAKSIEELESFQHEHTSIQNKLNVLEESIKKQLHDLNRTLVEAHYLNGVYNQRRDAKVFEDRPELTNEKFEVAKKKCKVFQMQVHSAQEEVHEAQGIMRTIRDMVRLYNQLLKEMNMRFPTAFMKDDCFKFPRTKEEENNLLKKHIQEARLQSKLEQRWIVSGWFSLVRQNYNNSCDLTVPPSSWLEKQRKALNSELRQKLC